MENTDQIDNTDYFAHISNDDLVTYFRQLLYSRMELIQYIYPDEFLEDSDDPLIEHINRCQGILYEKLEGTLNMTIGVDGHYLTLEVKNRKFEEKRNELFQLFNPIVEQFFKDVKVNYVDINADLVDIDFWGQDYSHAKDKQ